EARQCPAAGERRSWAPPANFAKPGAEAREDHLGRDERRRGQGDFRMAEVILGEDPANPTRLIVRPDKTIAFERRRFRLRVERGPCRGSELVSSEDRVVVGSHRGLDLALDDPAVSRAHFEILATTKGYLLRDLGSTNGTSIESVRVVEG